MKDVLVIGEGCRDVFIYCDALRLCPDVPVPILNIIDQTENAGMAKNVQRNILSRLSECDIITNSNWQQIVKTRYVHDKTNHTFFRVDTPHNIKPFNCNDVNFNDYKIIVISDYDKGFLTEDDIRYICNNHDFVFLDTKKVLGPWALGAKFIKINDHEYERSKKNILGTMTNQIIHGTMLEKIIRTKGGDGCEYNGKTYKVKEVEVKDVSGAGDSFLAALVIKYLESKDIIKSIKFANECASEVVKHRGVTIIS